MTPDQPTSTTHSVFGELRWEPQRECWFTQVRDADGEWIDVSVKPHEQDRVTVLGPAAELSRRVVSEERRILGDAVRREILDLYNGTWSRAGEEMTADELIVQLHLAYLELSPGWVVPVVLGYEAGDLFAGHAVDVELDERLQFLDVNLIG